MIHANPDCDLRRKLWNHIFGHFLIADGEIWTMDDKCVWGTLTAREEKWKSSGCCRIDVVPFLEKSKFIGHQTSKGCPIKKYFMYVGLPSVHLRKKWLRTYSRCYFWHEYTRSFFLLHKCGQVEVTDWQVNCLDGGCLIFVLVSLEVTFPSTKFLPWHVGLM